MGYNRARFSRELHRGKALDRFFVVVEADVGDLLAGRYKSEMNPKAAFESIMALSIRFSTPFVFAGNSAQAERVTYSLLQKYAAEIQKRHAILEQAMGSPIPCATGNACRAMAQQGCSRL